MNAPTLYRDRRRPDQDAGPREHRRSGRGPDAARVSASPSASTPSPPTPSSATVAQVRLQPAVGAERRDLFDGHLGAQSGAEAEARHDGERHHRDCAQEQRAAHPECGDPLPADHRDVPGAEPAGPAGARARTRRRGRGDGQRGGAAVRRRRPGGGGEAGAPGQPAAAPAGATPPAGSERAPAAAQAAAGGPARPQATVAAGRGPRGGTGRQRRAAGARTAAEPRLRPTAAAKVSPVRASAAAAAARRLRPEHDARRAAQAHGRAHGADDAGRARALRRRACVKAAAAVADSAAEPRRRARRQPRGRRRQQQGGGANAAAQARQPPGRRRRGSRRPASPTTAQGATTIDSLFGPLQVVETPRHRLAVREQAAEVASPAPRRERRHLHRGPERERRPGERRSRDQHDDRPRAAPTTPNQNQQDNPLMGPQRGGPARRSGGGGGGGGGGGRGRG